MEEQGGHRGAKRGRIVLSFALGFLLGAALLAPLAIGDINCPSSGYCAGNDQDNLIFGTDNYNNIVAMGGRDEVHAQADGDDVSGGTQSDLLYGGDGADTVDGGDSDEFYSCNEVACGIEGGAGADALHGLGADDYLNGGNADDGFYGGDGGDVLQANLDGQPGDDLNGGNGNQDTCVRNPGDDYAGCEFVETNGG
jgi:hypothetical protein